MQREKDKEKDQNCCCEVWNHDLVNKNHTIKLCMVLCSQVHEHTCICTHVYYVHVYNVHVCNIATGIVVLPNGANISTCTMYKA